MFSMDRFQFVRAKSDELIKETYRLRYEIYGKEFGFENVDEFPDGLETDEYEPYSIYFVALDGEEVVGTVRMVFHSEKGFPIEHAASIDFPGYPPPPDKTSEVSRLAVSASYRRRRGDGFYGLESYLKVSEGGLVPDSGPVPQTYLKRKRPVIIQGLYKAVYMESKVRGLTHLYFIVEQKLYNSLRKFGFAIKQVGDAVEYHGIRIPCIGVLDEMDRSMKENSREMYDFIYKDLDKEYHPFQ
ncbi:MAG: PEP-CTERM/exosortase system-associated acyltransferase [Desulfobacteraceae bacterium]|jgi:N-acyl amino acid synthase of PEP-CTERM/exosortase system